MPSEFSLSLGYELDPRAGHQLAATATSSATPEVVSSEPVLQRRGLLSSMRLWSGSRR
jgi:hypothetical protein